MWYNVYVIRKEMTPWKSALNLVAAGNSVSIGEKIGSSSVSLRTTVSADILGSLSKRKIGVKPQFFYSIILNFNLHTLNLTIYLFHVIISMSKGERKVASPLERFGQCVGESVPCVTLLIQHRPWCRPCGVGRSVYRMNHTHGLITRAFCFILTWRHLREFNK